MYCLYDDGKEENRYYAGLARFLRKIGIPVPAVLLDVPQEKLLVMEDLGETDLWTLRQEHSEECLSAYRSALDGLASLHLHGLKNLGAETPIMRDGFNQDYYRWEREYFLKNAVDDSMKIPLSGQERETLENELSVLAEILLSLPPQLVHRDCQSQNILWKNGMAYFIDFQGMRVGTGWYDVASLLSDPYVEISTKERSELISYYCEKINEPVTQETGKIYARAAAQRLMQALGAYFFLSEKMGKPHFRAYAFPALKNLVSVTAGTLPHLHSLAEKMLSYECKNQISNSKK